MDIDQFIEIVTRLADGVDPTTGKRLPPSSIYQQADTIRAIHLAHLLQFRAAHAHGRVVGSHLKNRFC